ncbi:MAG TPA: sugar transferase [Terriglobales bacterium]|nr:sugar transferase [Terriglobales bacterium]
MSSPAIRESDFYAHQIPPASRLIPGVAARYATVRRKKPQSVKWDRQYWVEEEAQEPVAGPDESPRGLGILEAILPTPANERERHHLIMSAAADFLWAALSLGIVTTVLRHSGVIPASVQLSRHLLYGALLTLLGYSEGLYRRDTPQELQAVILGKVLAWTTILTAVAFYSNVPASGFDIAASAPFLYFGLLGRRNWKGRKDARTPERRHVLIVGAGNDGQALANQLVHQSDRVVVCGFLDDQKPIGGDVLGRTADLARIARAVFADEVVLAGVGADNGRRIVREAHRNRLDVRVVPEAFGLQPLGIEHRGNTILLTLHEERIPGASLLIKRLADVLVAALMLAVSSPLLAVIALLIKLDSRGPVLYRASRMGKKGQQFLCYKFRTMVADADKQKEQLRLENEREGATFKIAGDPRITRLGRFLRRYSLDELPQLINVFKGEMSLVGPRPHPLDDCAHYALADLRRLDVVPGLTGLWQVSARSDPSFEKNMALDLEYIERWNLWMDLKILWQTVRVVVQGTGA